MYAHFNIREPVVASLSVVEIYYSLVIANYYYYIPIGLQVNDLMSYNSTYISVILLSGH